MILPSLIVATCGGGTGLPTQRECLEAMDCYGVGRVGKFAEIVAGTVIYEDQNLLEIDIDELRDIRGKGASNDRSGADLLGDEDPAGALELLRGRLRSATEAATDADRQSETLPNI